MLNKFQEKGAEIKVLLEFMGGAKLYLGKLCFNICRQCVALNFTLIDKVLSVGTYLNFCF